MDAENKVTGEKSLKDLALAKFPDLSEAERRLIEFLASGDVLDFRDSDDAKNTHANQDRRDNKRALRAVLIAWLCYDIEARKLIHDMGIQIKGAHIDGELSINYADFGKPLVLIGCSIPGTLECKHAQFKMLNLSGTHIGRLSANGVNVTADVFLCAGFTATGPVLLRGAVIGGNLECDGGAFLNEHGYALNANGVKVSGYVFMRGQCDFHGKVSLVGARVAGNFHWHGLKSVEKASLDLRGAKVGTVWIGNKRKADGECPDMPKQNQCWLDGFTYDLISNGMATDSGWWIEFFSRQKLEVIDGEIPFAPQPYEQAAKVLREHGHTEAAREVLIAKEELRKKTIPLRMVFRSLGYMRSRERQKRRLSLIGHWLWYRTGGPLIGYGHRPVYAIYVSMFIVILGTVIFSWAEMKDFIVPLTYWPSQSAIAVTAKGLIPPLHPDFNPFIYSLETFVPLIPLNQEEYWQVDATTWWGACCRCYAWAHTIFGWFLTTVLVASVSGVIKK